MTGRDLIIHILTNGLEDEKVFNNGRLLGFVTAIEAAEKLGVGSATIVAMFNAKMLEGVVIGDTLYISVTSVNERLQKEI